MPVPLLEENMLYTKEEILDHFGLGESWFRRLTKIGGLRGNRARPCRYLGEHVNTAYARLYACDRVSSGRDVGCLKQEVDHGLLFDNRDKTGRTIPSGLASEQVEVPRQRSILSGKSLQHFRSEDRNVASQLAKFKEKRSTPKTVSGDVC